MNSGSTRWASPTSRSSTRTAERSASARPSRSGTPPNSPECSKASRSTATADRSRTSSSPTSCASPSCDLWSAGWTSPSSKRQGGWGEVWINATQRFTGVSAEAWAWGLGFRPLEHFLIDRKGRRLDLAQIETFQRAIHAVRESIRLGPKLDATLARSSAIHSTAQGGRTAGSPNRARQAEAPLPRRVGRQRATKGGRSAR